MTREQWKLWKDGFDLFSAKHGNLGVYSIRWSSDGQRCYMMVVNQIGAQEFGVVVVGIHGTEFFFRGTDESPSQAIQYAEATFRDAEYAKGGHGPYASPVDYGEWNMGGIKV